MRGLTGVSSEAPRSARALHWPINCMPSPQQSWGYAQEALAEQLLSRLGFVIVERNWRGAGAEVDRIAWHEDVLSFIEVRARKGLACGRPEDTVGVHKQRHLVRAATAYLTRFSSLHPPMVRFDVVSVVQADGQPPEVTLIQNAFDAGR